MGSTLGVDELGELPENVIAVQHALNYLSCKEPR